MLNHCKISGFADEIHQTLETQIEVLSGLGQNYLELRSADGVNIAEMTREKAQEVKRKLQDADIRVSCLGSPIGKILITEAFAPHLESFLRVAELAHCFETREIRMFSFYLPEGKKPEAWEEEVFERIGKLKDAAAAEDVVLLHENEKGIYGDLAPRCRKLMEQFYGDHFQCTFDFANFVQCGQDTLEAYEQLKSYIACVHIKDAVQKTGEVVLPGDGDGNVAEILKKLEERKYKGVLSLEPHLAFFAGLEKLERKARELKEQEGIQAYQRAYRRLKELLEAEV